MTRIVRFQEPGVEPRLGLAEPDPSTTVHELEDDDVLSVLRGSHELTGRSIKARDAETLELSSPFVLLAPLVPPETWAAGVTYEPSRDARVDESRVEARDVYSLVYDAERPELFMKDAAGRRTVGPGATVGVRSDAQWTVPEPELAHSFASPSTTHACCTVHKIDFVFVEPRHFFIKISLVHIQVGCSRDMAGLELPGGPNIQNNILFILPQSLKFVYLNLAYRCRFQCMIVGAWSSVCGR